MSRKGIDVGFRVAFKTSTRNPKPRTRLLHFYGRARVGELGADGLGLFLRDALLDGLGRGLDEVFGLLQPERGYLADDLDDVDLVAACGLKNHVELGLL